jgi:xylulokinase
VIRYLVGIDIGTTAVKVILLDVVNNTIVSVESASHDLSSPLPGWAEENPADWWKNVGKTVKTCLSENSIDPALIAGVGVSGMVPAFILLDQSGELLRPSIQQSDARTSKEIQFLQNQVDGDEFSAITGCALNQQMVGPKILWMKSNEPGILEKTKHILGSYDYIVYKLTGEFSLERNWALESGLYDIQKRSWSNDLLNLVGLCEDLLPVVHDPSDVVGVITPEAAAQTGLRVGTPVVAGTADHVSSAFMAGIQKEGDLLVKFGGAGDILYSTDTLVTNPRLFIDYHLIPGKYLINGCMASSGSVLKWYAKEILNQKLDFKTLDREAERIPAGSEGIILLPYFIGEKTPIFDPLARGVFFGLTIHHTRYHLYRAIMEAVGYGFLHHIETLREIGCTPQNVIATNGGAVSRVWGGIVCNIIGLPIHYLDQNPGSSLGAAFVAGMGTGCFRDWSEVFKFIKISNRVTPDPEIHQRYLKLFEIYRSLYFDLKDDFVKLSEINL